MKINKLLANKLFAIASVAITGCSAQNNNALNNANFEAKPNEFWWPNKVNLSPLRQQAKESSPYENNYNYLFLLPLKNII